MNSPKEKVFAMMDMQQKAFGSALTLEKLAEGLRYGIVRHDVGEHDMCVCSFCGQAGHNDEPGNVYAIKHWPHCPAKLYDDWAHRVAE